MAENAEHEVENTLRDFYSFDFEKLCKEREFRVEMSREELKEKINSMIQQRVEEKFEEKLEKNEKIEI